MRKKAEKEVNRILEEIRKSEKNRQKADSRVTSLESRLKTLNDTLGQQEKEEGRLKKKLDREIRTNGFDSEADMLLYAVDEQEIAASERSVNAYSQAVVTNKKQLADAEKDAKGKTYTDIEQLKEICREQTARTARMQKDVHNREHRAGMNAEKQKSILEKKEELEKARRENAVCQRLYSLVRGTTGNGKITLEQYIQAAGFDGIIAAANRRLMPMSGGQYELYRQKDAPGRKSSSFLDLEVLDNYTGHRRPVGNLSGGESFKASLSLALGLSDTVSSNLGGIQMDALFVDEGFGTLDRKSMESALEILTGLTGSHKLVGIISHREELMENIPQQIRVVKSKDGSRITVERGL